MFVFVWLILETLVVGRKNMVVLNKGIFKDKTHRIFAKQII
jgi:hypothetical protein